jgi:hypothetical protein
MGRRHVKEFRPDEALSLISADRAGKTVICPCCGADAMARSPVRGCVGDLALGPVTLTCAGCGRVVSYIDRGRSERQGARAAGPD